MRCELASLLTFLLLACAGTAPQPPARTEASPPPSVEPAPARATDEGEPIADSYPTPESAPSAAPAASSAPAPGPPPAVATPDDKLDERMLADALLGRRQHERKNVAGARRQYAKVLAAWADPEAAVKHIMAASADEAQGLRRVGQALTAVGEALFFEAGQKREKALALRPPAFKGNPSDEAIRRHLGHAVADWMRKRRALDDEAEQAYRKVLELQPLPPPRWVVASASEVGTMLEALPAALEKVPVPPSIKRDPALLSAYRAALHDATAPQRERAKAAFRACLGYAERYQQHDAYSQTCSARLAALEAQGP